MNHLYVVVSLNTYPGTLPRSLDHILINIELATALFEFVVDVLIREVIVMSSLSLSLLLNRFNMALVSSVLFVN